jgi:hypothetical protein
VAILRAERLQLFSIRTGRTVAVRLPGVERLFDAALEPDGMFYAGSGQIGFAPRNDLDKAIE